MLRQNKIEESLQNASPALDSSYLSLLKDVEVQPIFIMGDHRSGTTLLYKLLAATECFNVVTAYHIIKYNELLFHQINQTEVRSQKELDEHFQFLGLQNRIIDKVAVTSSLPEEYGFILENAGKPSHICPENLGIFIELCKKIQFVSEPNRDLLLKNPWDFTNFLYIKQAFPQSRFIFLHRQPIHIINSQLKASRSLLKMKSLYSTLISKQYNKMYDNPWHLLYQRLLNSVFSSRSLRRATQDVANALSYFIESVNSVPNTDYICIKYEELSQDTETVVLRILNFLGLEPKSPLSYNTVIESRPLRLLPEIEVKYDDLYRELRSYFDYFGYN
ncbi:MAG TPA: sulfotransferase [Cyanobacteria bacterium UBA11149]|nr:sulfotransferase [Cyanobacteria bacterium UBA11367]HBE60941.1 sulfotransferase [Cyanobacteria bacterium UBA11366]HBK62444.1 sulfotransferase [Cyanobacteria bacterium UBA11166]HBR76403.1 sulfotransferase [Cyanobacteria bacterium UBA11159]HBS72058.1 sulfotransferase [Cyanobacteria bacterium UBA11153]HBW89753.1 sulfotransferase [Cyanobacteria bacterium UBA11149]HCA95471.1 sulfotransferase [Cyanobacteria bacterium UBA9226]